jgi:hypothetical protein
MRSLSYCIRKLGSKTAKAPTETRRVLWYETPSRLRNLLRRKAGFVVSMEERKEVSVGGGFELTTFTQLVKEFVSAASALNH